MNKMERVQTISLVIAADKKRACLSLLEEIEKEVENLPLYLVPESKRLVNDRNDIRAILRKKKEELK